VNANRLDSDGARKLASLIIEYPRTYERHGRVFDAGEVASYFNLSAFRAGLDLLLDVGVPSVETFHRALQDRAVEALADVPLRPVTNLGATHRSPMLMFEGRNGLDLARLEADLSARHIAVSLRAGRMRLSPGIWNDASDIDAFVEAVRACALPS
jgi:cysteine desulfurase/selenocysteine lyase